MIRCEFVINHVWKVIFACSATKGLNISMRFYFVAQNIPPKLSMLSQKGKSARCCRSAVVDLENSCMG